MFVLLTIRAFVVINPNDKGLWAFRDCIGLHNIICRTRPVRLVRIARKVNLINNETCVIFCNVEWIWILLLLLFLLFFLLFFFLLLFFFFFYPATEMTNI